MLHQDKRTSWVYSKVGLPCLVGRQVSTDPTLSPEQILQPYLWRWEIELNFRDEKTLLGSGNPQVRSDPTVRTTATFFVFV